MDKLQEPIHLSRLQSADISLQSSETFTCVAFVEGRVNGDAKVLASASMVIVGLTQGDTGACDAGEGVDDLARGHVGEVLETCSRGVVV